MRRAPLNARGVITARGGIWTAVQVGSILRRAALQMTTSDRGLGDRALSAGTLPMSAFVGKATSSKQSEMSAYDPKRT